MNQVTVSIVVVNITSIIEASNVTATIADPTIIIKTIDATINLNATT
jgi:hypothetical protein